MSDLGKFIDSNSITVFPSGFRREGIDLSSRLTTEKNLTNIKNLVSDVKQFNNFILSDPDNEDNVYIGIHGYIFNLEKTELQKDDKTYYIYAYIKLNSLSDSIGNILSPISDSNSTTTSNGTILDEQDNENKFWFKGLYLVDELPEGLDCNYYIKLSNDKNTLNNYGIRLNKNSIVNNYTKGDFSSEKTIDKIFTTTDLESTNLNSTNVYVNTIKALSNNTANISIQDFNNLQINSNSKTNYLNINDSDIKIKSGKGGDNYTAGITLNCNITNNSAGFINIYKGDNNNILLNQSGIYLNASEGEKIVNINSRVFNVSSWRGSINLSRDNSSYLAVNYIKSNDLYNEKSIYTPNINLSATNGGQETTVTNPPTIKGILSENNSSYAYLDICASNSYGIINLNQSDSNSKISVNTIYLNNIKFDSNNSNYLNSTNYTGTANCAINADNVKINTSLNTNTYLVGISKDVGSQTSYQNLYQVNANIIAQGSKLIVGSLYASSDERLKENIKDSNINASDLLNKIKIREYNFKEDDNKNNIIGCIAQELREILPCNLQSIVKGDESVENLSVNNDQLIYLLIKAFQEKCKELEELKNKLK